MAATARRPLTPRRTERVLSAAVKAAAVAVKDVRTKSPKTNTSFRVMEKRITHS
jgi:hypothetical protein